MSDVVHARVGLVSVAPGPLGPHLATFAAWAAQRGYAVSTCHDQVRLAAGFSRWLGQRGVGLRSISPDHVGQFLQYRRRRLRPHVSDDTVLRRVLEVLTDQGVLRRPAAAAPRRATLIEREAHAYLDYLRQERGLQAHTAASYARFVRRFLADRCARTRVPLARLRPTDVIGFIRRHAPRLHPRQAKLLTTALRSFLHYGWYRGVIAHDLGSVVPTVPQWSTTSIPRAIPPDLVQRLLRAMERRTRLGRRDYAIVLLLARLGLRAGEVAGLALEDIDWPAGRLRLRRKGGRTMDLPLPADVGHAIVAYLREGRPRRGDRHVFLRARAPHCGLRTIGSVVRRALRGTGIDAPTKGTHQFRHGLATDMLRRGASLLEIGAVLGHRSLNSTKQYAHVDVVALRTLALPWPGGAR